MTVLDKFVAYTEALPADRRLEIEEILESIMGTDDPAPEFTAEELSELDRRLADPDPRFADPAEVEAVFRRFGAR